MAENESLDLADSRRWQLACHAIRQGKSSREVASRVVRGIYSGLRAAFKEFAKKGVTVKDMLAARDDAHGMHGLVKKTRGHDYAQLFAETALAEKGASDDAFLENYVWAICEKMFDQVAREVVPCENWDNFPDLNRHFNEVREEIARDVRRIADNLAKDPDWLPKRQGAKSGGSKVDDTLAMLDESLLGVPSK